ncbi:neuronal acetylcholine receptor subunit alpha-7-like [Amphiura filiformis]|uniref:neuronal acetylcholine receptor subunit alpha-7-like n=1 Tax=Amphiura filiformis TaxID=82378 RepID=UPI003B21AEE0
MDASHPRGHHYNLTTELLSNYGSTLPRPVVNSSTQIEVVITLDIYRLIELNEKMQTLTVSALITMVWHDEFLTWNTSKYPIPYLGVPPSSIWRPDLRIYDNVDGKFEDFRDNDALIFPDGRVEWATSNILKTYCVIDARLLPFDTQRCHLKFRSWSYNLKQVNLFPSHIETDFIGTGIWELEAVVSLREVLDYAYLG